MIWSMIDYISLIIFLKSCCLLCIGFMCSLIKISYIHMIYGLEKKPLMLKHFQKKSWCSMWLKHFKSHCWPKKILVFRNIVGNHQLSLYIDFIFRTMGIEKSVPELSRKGEVMQWNQAQIYTMNTKYNIWYMA